MADNKNIVDDVLSKGIFGKVATKYTSRASKEKVVEESVAETEPVVTEPVVTEPEPEPVAVVTEKSIAVKPKKKTDPVKNVYNKGAFRDIASKFVKGTLIKMIDPNKEVKVTEKKEILNTATNTEEVQEVQEVQEVVESKEERSISATIDYVESMLEGSASIASPASFNKDAPVSSTTVQHYIDVSAQKEIMEATMNLAGDTNMSVDAKLKALERKMHQLASIYAGGGTNGGGGHSHSEVTILSGEHTADVAALSSSIDDIKANGVAGYDVTGAFFGKDAGAGAVWTSTTGIEYTSEQASTQKVITFSLDSSIQPNTDNPYWTNPTPVAHTGVGLFGGSYLPENVSPIFNFTEVDSDTFEDGTNIPTTGRISLSGCSFGDQLRLRFDLIVIPQITNTTVTPMLWYKNRTEAGVVTYSFELPTQPIFFGQGTVGKEYLNRVEISAWIANEEDVHALVYPAMKADNPCIVKPNSMMATILR